MELAFGVDVCGGKSAWVLLDAEGGVIHRGRGPGLAGAAVDPASVARQLRSIMHSASAVAGGVSPQSMVADLAGAARPAIRTAIRDALALPFPCAVVGDVEAVAATCLHQAEGVAVWAGRDSFAVARSADGSLHRAGGRGWMLDDRGSAFAIVRMAAAAVVEAADGVGPKTALTEALLHAFSISDPLQLGPALEREWPNEIADAAPEVLSVADDGDLVASRVLREEARALASRALAASRRAGLVATEAAVWFGGDVLTSSERFGELLRDAIGELGLIREPARAEGAEVGAARLAGALGDVAHPLRAWIEDERTA